MRILGPKLKKKITDEWFLFSIESALYMENWNWFPLPNSSNIYRFTINLFVIILQYACSLNVFAKGWLLSKPRPYLGSFWIDS